MTLPLTRDETAAPGGKVSSTLLNDIQDLIINMYPRAKTGSRVKAVVLVPTASTLVGFVAGNARNGYTCPTLTTGFADFLLPTEVGERIDSVTVTVDGPAVATDITALVRSYTQASGVAYPGPAGSVLAGPINKPASVSMQKIVVPVALTVAADVKYYVEVAAANTAGAKSFVRIDYAYSWV